MILNITLDTNTDAELATRVIAALGGEHQTPVPATGYKPGGVLPDVTETETKTVPLIMHKEPIAEEAKSYDDMDFEELKAMALGHGLDVSNKRSAGLRQLLKDFDAGKVKPVAEEDTSVAEEPMRPELVQDEAEPEDNGDDLLGDAEDDEAAPSEYTQKDAVARVSELVGEGKAAEARAALAKMGVKRVSELEEGQIDKFMKSVASL